jgi:hypothetical protein
MFVEEAGGMEKINQLQEHENVEIYKKSYQIIDKYFSDENENYLEPEVDATGKFTFNGEMQPQGGFSF